MEGFKTDVQMLRKKVHDLEKQLFKVRYLHYFYYICCICFRFYLIWLFDNQSI